jgi:hypothetical protein
MKAYGEVDVQIRILTSALVGTCVVGFTPRPLYPRGNIPWNPLVRRMDGPQSRSGRCGENSWSYRDSNSDPSVVQPVASRYTDSAITPPLKYSAAFMINFV